MSQDDPTPKERAEAEALARALEGEGGSPELPQEALEAAALLRYSRDGGELPADRRAAILDEILEEAGPPATPERPAGWRRLIFPGGFVSAAAAVAAIIAVLVVPTGQEPADATPLPPPSLALLEAQGAAAQAGTVETDGLPREMRRYRGEMYAALSRHYGAER